MKEIKKEVLLLSEYERKGILRSRIHKALSVISTSLLMGLWVLVSSSPASKFPSPAEIQEHCIKPLNEPIEGLGPTEHIWVNLQRVFIVLGLSWALGISFSVLIGWNKKVDAILGSISTAFRAVPPLAWTSLVTMWFGTGEFPKVLIMFIGTLMPVVTNTHAGISNAEKEYSDIRTIFNANSKQMLFETAIPSALDAIFAGVRSSASAGWMVVLATKMLGGKSGAGFLVVRGMDSGDYPLCLLAMICIDVVGCMLAILIQLLERIVCPWTIRKSI